MCCPRNDRPDTQALSVNVLMKWKQRRSACAWNLDWAVHSRTFKRLCCKTSAFYFVKQQMCFDPSLTTALGSILIHWSISKNAAYTFFSLKSSSSVYCHLWQMLLVWKSCTSLNQLSLCVKLGAFYDFCASVLWTDLKSWKLPLHDGIQLQWVFSF